MKYLEFKNRVSKLPVVSASQLGCLGEDSQVLRNQLTRWEKKGLIIKLRRGLYVLNSSDRRINPSRMYLANQLYPPSYVSTEYALGFYGLIPEKVSDVTSVTPRKTFTIKNAFGLFVYQHVTHDGFKGFTLVRDENDFQVMIASPEKAVVDFIYLNLAHFKEADIDLFEESYRFQNVEQLKVRKLRELAASFNNATLMKIMRIFFSFMRRR